ncbi:type I-G CRISPR-associated helicase/endonuclease Cas3g [Azohydromonas lata]|uniref:type I-G CRISPR-associated helicase/endonuclease Cas3g n=1 Tax=Azohydromonas lata TaxID=45677 RepID=UPI000833B4B9|nr:type I-U CRISPR-associated helicase/endonuclease Cas3 [Azohydromonas lata]
MSDLTFQEFFTTVHGQQPFPWQVRAAARLARREAFDVTVPTGLGKSALVDAAVWAAAQGGWRRIVFVVDRRIVVDAVHQRVERIQRALQQATYPALRELSQRVGEMQVVRLRGGVFGDDDWVLYPERLSVVLSTVDQLGSRLLFRGYGVSPRRWPLHAAFLASDTLIVVDEAHLSMPLLQTLQVLRAQGADITVTPMSATLPGHRQDAAVGLEADDLAVETVRWRLAARKLVRLRAVKGSGGEDFIKALCEETEALRSHPGVAKVGVVVNRVATARRCFERLHRASVPCVLLTGRVRSLERDRQLQALLPQIQAGRQRRPDHPPMVVVATQTIEVGADLDLDALVSECAPLSALRQRFGRLDRLGERGESRGVVLYREKDPVYGTASDDAWAWLQAREEEAAGMVDFGVGALEEVLGAHPAPVEAASCAATLLPVHLEMLAQTGAFAPELDVRAWLHGPSDKAAEVTLVWRDDLLPGAPEDWPRAVALLPPMQREGLPMPAAAVRRWLTGAAPGDQWSDLESVADEGQVGDLADRPVLRWRGADDCRVVTARQVRPGDTLVLPAAYGGCDEWGWAPESSTPVADIADNCLLEPGRPRRPAARLVAGRWAAFGDDADWLHALVQALCSLEARAAAAEDDLCEEIHAAQQALLDAVAAGDSPLLARLKDVRLEPHPGGYVLRGAGVEEIEGQIEIGRAVALDKHHDDVRRWARRLSAGDMCQAQVVEAAAVHDAGKAEPRMQVLLHGSVLAAQGGRVLAKSALRSRTEQLAAWRLAGVPRGFRHEFASLDFKSLADPLTRHLVATHHGLGRPWLPGCAEPTAAGMCYAGLPAHWPAAWAGMLAQHGPWRLAQLEWLLRAADARASMEEAAVSPIGERDEQC